MVRGRNSELGAHGCSLWRGDRAAAREPPDRSRCAGRMARIKVQVPAKGRAGGHARPAQDAGGHRAVAGFPASAHDGPGTRGSSGRRLVPARSVEKEPQAGRGISARVEGQSAPADLSVRDRENDARIARAFPPRQVRLSSLLQTQLGTEPGYVVKRFASLAFVLLEVIEVPQKSRNLEPAGGGLHGLARSSAIERGERRVGPLGGVLLHVLRNQLVAHLGRDFVSHRLGGARIVEGSALHLLLRGELIAQVFQCRAGKFGEHPDRKSTRLNSSHANISYAVF